eukprot:883672-Rhodomonas_salina.1
MMRHPQYRSSVAAQTYWSHRSTSKAQLVRLPHLLTVDLGHCTQRRGRDFHFERTAMNLER